MARKPYEVPEPLRDETFPQGETKQVDGKVVPVVHGVYLNMEFTFGTTGAVAEDRINGRCKKAYIVLFNKREWEFVAFPPLEDQPARNDDIRPF
jgi:hypothetical protein